ncbi:DUF2778 domain-containing protein [uncultured Bradyrhizobium sp.]|uniref:DUF2778 domain-containing protein n=1 Tax=uncultured Bradyrhizobium sp. TaxID=199684 RepID=UPI0035C9E985
MTYGTGTRYDSTAYPVSSRKTLSRILFGAVALACIGLGWSIASQGLHSQPDQTAVSSGVAPDGLFSSERLTFNARFEALGAPEGISVVRKSAPAPRHVPDSIRKTYMALLDVTYSLGSPPASFSTAMPRGADRQLALPDVPDAQSAPVAFAAPVQHAAQSVPLPAARPSTLRLMATREVEKAKQAIMSVASADKPSIFEKLFGKLHSGPALAFASADIGDVGFPTLSKAANPMGSGMYDRSTAVYDISARTVYLPDGTKLEAHSGLGAKLDDPRYVHVKMHGATPPHVYDLEPREALFHGVPALRLKPVGGEDAIFGRTGLLAHTYMLGPNGDSNGCVSFKDYYAFLNAYRNGGVKRLAVVAKVE